MTTYFCKCGEIKRKPTSAETTGNHDTEDCSGCPYLLPYGEYKLTDGEVCKFDVKGYECRMSKSLEYGSAFGGSIEDKRSCYVASLDFDFLEQISDWIRETFLSCELIGEFARDKIRAAEYSSNGRYHYSICCAQNKVGVAAKAALLERFFNPDGSRKDMTPEEEKNKILQDIENGKAAALRQDRPECLCASCTCIGCHEACFGHCQGCGDPVDHCNSYQTEGDKRLKNGPDGVKGGTA